MAERRRTRVSCDQRGCHAEAWDPARGWSQEGKRDFCRQHTASRAARFTCPPEHKHAEVSTCYSAHRCRCDACSAEHTRSAARRSRDKVYGRWIPPRVDAVPVRAHVLLLCSQGLDLRAIADAAGVGRTTVAELVHGRKGSTEDDHAGEVLERIPRRTAERILAVSGEESTLAARVSVDARGTRRRIQALVARGWCLSRIAGALDVQPSNLTVLLERDRVRLGTKRRVADLYERLWNVTPPRQSSRDAASYSRAIDMARSRSWLPPMAWDDIDTDEAPPVDDGVDELDQGAIDAAVDGYQPPLRTTERREVVRILHARRWSDQRIAGWLGKPDRTILRDREALQLAAFPHAELRWAS